MMRALAMAAVAGMFMASAASTEPFQEVVVGVPVASVVDAEAWYHDLFGPDVEIIRPVPGVVEFKVAPGVWFQIFEAEGQQASGNIVRFKVDDIYTTQRDGAELGINMGEAIEVPNVVTYSEFADPDGNALGLYDLP
jgi:predicted enzyme related to lactoylglutathione lyase